MLFSSLTFLLLFLPAAIAGSWLSVRAFGTRGAVVFLSVASFVFYGWHYPPYVVLLALTIVFNYVVARRIDEFSACQAGLAKVTTAVAVAANLGLLAWFKYAGFLNEMVIAIAGVDAGLPSVLLPLGISFFTFQQIAYLVDIHQKKAKPGALLDYVFLISFFPQLIAGPIVHHKQLVPQLQESRFASFRIEDISAGLLIFSIGLAKKVLIADTLSLGADELFTTQALGVPISTAEAWLGMLCYTFQIYFDFSGYSDMALGLGLMFGLQLPENFRSPYKSRNIIEFWRRWNITLSTFLRDYLYFPLGGNRIGKFRRYANLWIVMLLGGLWHGAGWQFVVWGGLHGFYLTVNHIWQRQDQVKIPVAVATAMTFIAVVIAWVFFRSEDFGQAFAIIQSLLWMGDAYPLAIEIFSNPSLAVFTVLIAAAIVWSAPNAVEIAEAVREGRFTWFTPATAYRAAGVVGALAIFKTYASGSYAFIYFQF